MTRVTSKLKEDMLRLLIEENDSISLTENIAADFYIKEHLTVCVKQIGEDVVLIELRLGDLVVLGSKSLREGETVTLSGVNLTLCCKLE